MWTTIRYRIEPVSIPQTPGASRTIWFLDAVQQNEEGRLSVSNICNGDEKYCRDTLADILKQST